MTEFSIYAVQIKDTSVFKIGWSQDPKRRRKEIQTTSHIPPGDCLLAFHCVVTKCLKRAREYEAAVHWFLEPYKLGEEWFRVDEEVVHNLFDLSALRCVLEKARQDPAFQRKKQFKKARCSCT